jgi:hypothetical protein
LRELLLPSPEIPKEVGILEDVVAVAAAELAGEDRALLN